MNEKRPAKIRSVPPPSSRGSRARVPRSRADGTIGPGSIIGRRYQIHSRIGAGGMGVVYGAIEMTTGLEVAIKVLSSEAASPQNVRRFRREAQTAASVKNRYCCQVFGAGVEAGAPYIVMERLAGETLRRRLVDDGAMSAADAVRVMLQMLEGLAAAHAAGVIHRDIKPGNVFITTARGTPPTIKIIDFGLAKLLPSTKWQPRDSMPLEEMSSITSTNVVPGTPMYLAPEQVRGDRDLDERVDIWAAGLTFYETLLNQRAFSGSTYVALAKSIVLTTLPAVSSLRTDLPPGFDRILARALAKHRDQRFPSATAFRDALRDEWALFRTAAVVRGQQLRKFRGKEKKLPSIDEVGVDEPTEINVDILFDPDGLG